MSEIFVNVDRETPLLLPADLREWVPEDDLVHFVIEAVEGISMSSFKVNERGSGSAQYPPRMMPALLIYCYANGIFSSRRIEQAKYRDIGVRYLTGDTHPDHDTIAKFRRENFEAVVDASGSRLVLGARVSACASDSNELVADVRSVPESLGKPGVVLADNGYLNEKEVRCLEGGGEAPEMEVLISVHAEARQIRRAHDLPPLPPPRCLRKSDRGRRRLEVYTVHPFTRRNRNSLPPIPLPPKIRSFSTATKSPITRSKEALATTMVGGVNFGIQV